MKTIRNSEQIINYPEALHAAREATASSARLMADMQRVVDVAGRSDAVALLRDAHDLAGRIEQLAQRIERAA